MDETGTAGQSVLELCEEYIRLNLLRPASARQYRCVASLLVRDIGIRPLTEVDENLLLAWRADVLARSSAVTWNHYRRHLRVMWYWGMRRGLVAHDPFMHIKSAPESAGQLSRKLVPPEVLAQALELLGRDVPPVNPGWFWAAALRLFVTTGMRRQQLVGLQWGHIDFQKQRLLLIAETSKTHREWWIPIADESVADLRMLHDRLAQKVTGIKPEMPVFHLLEFIGKPMTPERVTSTFRRLREVLGAKIGAHRLRHTFASAAANSPDPTGNGLRALQDMLGHTSVITTMGYVHPDMQRQRLLQSAASGVLRLQKPMAGE